MKNLIILAPIVAALTLIACDRDPHDGDQDKKMMNASDHHPEGSNSMKDAVSKTDFTESDNNDAGGDYLSYYDAMEQERYAKIVENKFITAADIPLSTFSVDVDTASYSNLRDLINRGIKPNKDAVRIEEMKRLVH